MNWPPDSVRGPAIVLEGVSKAFSPGAQALGDVTLTVPAGEFLAVVGASGSGKTTMLRVMHRLIEPDQGMVRILGYDASTAPHVLRRQVGYVFQGVGLFPHLTVAENVAITPRLAGWPRKQIDARVVEMLDLVGLPASGYAERAPHMLSGGQRQRVGLARALAARPRVMLMDEPFGALDPLTRDELGCACRGLHQALGLTTVMVTHDVTEALLMADRILVMRSGRIAALDRPSALAVSPDPYVAALFEKPRSQLQRMASALNARSGMVAHG
jgi:osmoprotectant transport system ATP-binding protein